MLDRSLLAPHALAARATTDPDATAVQHVDGPTMTFGELHDEATRWAAAYRRFGVGPAATWRR